jgi:hypothetical protein
VTEVQVIYIVAAIAGAVASAIGTALAIWFRIDKRIKDGETAASLQIEAAAARALLVASQLGEYKTHVAETYVSKQGLREVRDEIMSAVRDLKGGVASIHERIDQVILSTDKRRSPN